MITVLHRREVPKFGFRVGKLQTPCLDELSAPFDVSRTVRENKKTTRRIELSDRSLIIVRSHWRTMNEMTLSERFKCVRQISATDVQRDDGAVLIAQLTNSAPSGVGDRIIDQFKFLAN